MKTKRRCVVCSSRRAWFWTVCIGALVGWNASCAEPAAGVGTRGTGKTSVQDAGGDVDATGGTGTGGGDDVAQDVALDSRVDDVLEDPPVDVSSDAVSDSGSDLGVEDVAEDVPQPPEDVSPDVPNDVEDDSGGGDECATGQFAQTGSLWDLPPSFSGEIGVQSDQAACSARGDLLHVTTDLNGDGRPDLVITSDCDDTTPTGTTQWLVYFGGRTGFDFSERVWPVPDLGPAQMAVAEDQARCSETGDFLHILRDMDGDGRPDLVVTSDCDLATPLGTSFWRVYRNTASGFMSTPLVWGLPVGWSSEEFVTAQDQEPCVSDPPGDLLHATMDLTGDGRPDLVITSDCNANTVTGRTEWLVYPNNGVSFAPPAIPFSLPTSVPQGNLATLQDQAVCAVSQDILHTTTDLTGDGFTDLVVTSDCDPNTPTGLSLWQVFAGNGSRFAAAPILWPLPSGYLSGQLASAHDQGTCTERGDLLHSLIDLDGDGMRDLVLSSDCQAETPTGLQRWVAHRNTGDSFANSPTRWALPPSTPAGEIATLEDQAACGGQNDLLYFTGSFDEFSGADLVITSDCNATTSIGLTQWLVFAGQCLD